MLAKVFGLCDRMQCFLVNAITAATFMPAQISAVRSPEPAYQVEAENTAARMKEQDMHSQIVQGYESDPCFKQDSHTAGLEVYNGFYYKGDALGIPAVPELKTFILKELHDADYAGHVGYHSTACQAS